MPSTLFPVPSLYAITPDWQNTRILSNAVRAVIWGGASCVQYRNKHAIPSLRYEQALSLLQVCLAEKVPLIINDDIALARAIGADGVHLGVSDGDWQQARKDLPPPQLLGVTCHNRLDLGAKGLAISADYLGFGSLFNSKTKPDAIRLSPDILRQAKNFGLSLVAIGGITIQNAGLAIEAGANAIAVGHGLFGDPIAGVDQLAEDYPAGLEEERLNLEITERAQAFCATLRKYQRGREDTGSPRL